MSKTKIPVTTTGEPVDWDAVAKKHPKLITALGMLGIKLVSTKDDAVEKAVEQVVADTTPKPAAANVAGVEETGRCFTLRPSSTGREHFVEVCFEQNPGKALCEELKSVEFRYSRFNSCWYGHKDNLPARYRAGLKEVTCLSKQSSTPTSTIASAPMLTASEPLQAAPVPTVPPTLTTVLAASSSSEGSKDAPTSPTTPKADSVNVPLTVRRTLGGNMDRGFSVVHVASNKAIGSAYQNLSEEEANRLLTIVLPLADWTKPVAELLKVPGLQDKLARALCTPAPVIIEPTKPMIAVVPPPAPVDKGKPVPGTMYALTGAKGTPAISNGNTWAESEVKPEEKADPVAKSSGVVARLKALCRKDK